MMERRSYRLVIEGEVDGHSASAFNGMALKREAGTTILARPIVTGLVRDQRSSRVLQRVAGLADHFSARSALGLAAAMTADLTTSHTLRQGSSKDARS